MDEAELVIERLGQLEGQRATLTWMALSAIPSMGIKGEHTKKAHGNFMGLIKQLMGSK